MGWGQLGAIHRENELHADRKRQGPIIECPVHKYPLEQGRVPGQFHCLYGGDSFDLTGKPIYI
jgi:hypothetical protein